MSWFTHLKTTYEMCVQTVSLPDLRQWQVTAWDIHHVAQQYFSVIAVAVEAGNREVVGWTQPLLKHVGCGIVGFLTQPINDTLHFLVHAALEPGNRDLIEMGPTVACSEPERQRQATENIPFLSYFLQPEPDTVRYTTVQSEEGGRFYHFQNQYMILETRLKGKFQTLPPDYIWLTLGRLLIL
ncbi:MAG: NDP-hexose 2,3-dehydratase family protein [Chloroflexi bacterium]|nr:NDP-hexose 2,3-dehydratase family protein [Chloroflexota bacterium]